MSGGGGERRRSLLKATPPPAGQCWRRRSVVLVLERIMFVFVVGGGVSLHLSTCSVALRRKQHMLTASIQIFAFFFFCPESGTSS